MSQASQKDPVVRAIDVGYGHVKFVISHDPRSGKIECGRFPSRSPRAQGQDLSAGVMGRLDTWIVKVNGQDYEVGRDVISAAAANDASEILSRDFALSDAYLARLYGALSYMEPGLRGSKIDWLVLGLPNSTWAAMAEPLAKKVKGKHVVNSKGKEIEVANVLVFPQPMGAFFDYAYAERKVDELKKQVSLIVEPGYNTVDWLFLEGLAPSKARSGCVELGMSQVIRAIAQDILAKPKRSGNIDRMINRIDHALANSLEYRLSGTPIKLSDHFPAGMSVVEQAINAVKKSAGDGDDIDNIFIAGGGTPFYSPTLSNHYPDHKVIQIADPQFAVVRGLQVVGDNKARSAVRAMAA